MASDRSAVIRAAQRYGKSLDHIARRYTNPITGKPLSGAALLVKVVSGESSFDRNSVSSVGAKGLAQFMPSSRAEAIRRFGIDPWRTPDEAVHAAALHLRGKINGSTGLEGYNPGGGQGYVDYILRQRVGSVGGSSTQRASGGSRGAAGTPRSGPSAGGSPFADTPATGLADTIKATTAPVIQTAGLQAPAFSAQVATPKGFKLPASVGVQPPQELQLPDPTSQSLPTVAAAAPTAKAATRAPTGGGSEPPLPKGATRVKGAVKGSPIAGQRPQRSSHQTAGLDGYPAYDYMAPAGTAVAAPVSGTVIKRSGKDPKLGGPPGGPLGYSVYIKGTDGKIYYLTHIDRVRPKVGQRVRQGQKIAVIANGPASWSSPHVHMGVHG